MRRVRAVTIDPFTRAHDAVVDALTKVEAAWRLRQENPALLRHAVDGFHRASRAFADPVEQWEESREG